MKQTLTALLLLTLALSAHANPITPATARRLAARHLPQPVEAADLGAPRTLTANIGQAVRAYYLFNNAEGEGFAIVAADDRLGTVLGYSDRGSISAERMPEGLRQLLQAYTAAAEALTVDSVKLTPAYAKRPKARVEPLVQTQWDQSYPYNYYTPRINGQATYTGCVNTAVAQIMSVHQWPVARPEGMPAGEGAMALDHYDWANMLADYSGSYSDAQAQAVGALMRDLGAANSTTYGTQGTTSNEGYAWMALEQRYGYSVRYLEKNMLRGGEFLEAVYNELSLGCPILITGSNHAFVYDGYDNDGLVHINWGWSGSYDGFYDINTVANSGAGSGSNGLFYEEQHALLLRPDDGRHELFPPQPVVLTVTGNDGLSFAETSTTTDGTLSVVLNGVASRNLAQSADGTFTGTVGIGLFSSEGTCLHIFERPGAVLKWSSFFGSYNFSDDWQISLSDFGAWADGTYYMRPLSHRRISAETNEWEEWRNMQNGGQVVLAVRGTEVSTVPSDNRPDLRLVGRPEVVAPLYEYGSDRAAIAVRIANLSRHEAYGSVKLTLTGTGALEGESYDVPASWLNLYAAGARDTTLWTLPFYTSYTGTQSAALKAGTYCMTLTFNHNRYVDTAEDYTLAVPDDFRITVYPSSTKGRVTVNNVSISCDGAEAATTSFHADETPQIELGITALAKYFATDTYATTLRYRIVSQADGTDALTSKGFGVSTNFNEPTDLTAATRFAVDLTALAPATYEIHVEEDRNGAWLDLWNSSSPRRTFTVCAARPDSFTIAFDKVAWRTLYTDRPYRLPEGIEAYQVDAAGNLTAIASGAESDVRIAAESALLLHAPMGSAFRAGYVKEANTQPTGRLKGSLVDVTTSAGGEDAYFYKLTHSADGAHYGFYWGAPDGAAFVNTAGNCYLSLPKSPTGDDRASGFALETLTPSAITPVISVPAADSPATYDLSGRRIVNPAARGVYIVGRRKVLK